MSGGTTVDTRGQRELELHKKTYLQLFQAVLLKKGGEESARKSTLKSLRTYLDETVHNTDEFIDHLGEFATRLGVPPAALGKFIGSNFMQALERVQKAQESEKVSASPARSTGGVPRKKYQSILEELIEVLDLSSPGRFINHEYGLLKLESPEGVVLPLSDGGTPPAEKPSDSPSPGEASVQSGGVMPVTGKSPATSSGKAPPRETFLSTDKDPPLMEEIQSEFPGVFTGSPEPLVVDPFAGLDEESGTVSSDSSPSPSTVDPAVPDKKKPSVAGKPLTSSRSSWNSDQNGSILDEIKKMVEGTPGAGERLVLRDLDSEDEEASYPATADGDSTGSAPGEDSVEESGGSELPDPVELDFLEFAGIMKRVQDFQAKKDLEGYRAWLGSPGQELARAVVGLRNIDGRKKKGEPVREEEEYRRLGGALGKSEAAIQDLQSRVRFYSYVQQLLQRVTVDVRARGGRLVQEFRIVWGPIRQIFNEPGDPDSCRSRLKMILLQVGETEIRNEILRLMDPVFEKAARYRNRIQ